MNDKILIIYNRTGYDIITEDGSIVEFNDSEQTSGFNSKKDAMTICQRHGYFFTSDNGYAIEMSYKSNLNDEGL